MNDGVMSFWVRLRPTDRYDRCPLYPWDRNSLCAHRVSARCQNRTFLGWLVVAPLVAWAAEKRPPTFLTICRGYGHANCAGLC
jgi:hypothetical protein